MLNQALLDSGPITVVLNDAIESAPEVRVELRGVVADGLAIALRHLEILKYLAERSE